MSTPYWQYETSISPVLYVSIRGDCNIPLDDYTSYLMEFIEKYQGRLIKVGKVDVIHLCMNEMEYCSVISLNDMRSPIDFPGRR